MGSDAHPRRQVAITALARDGPAAVDRRSHCTTPSLIRPEFIRAGPAPEAPRSALEPRAQEGLIALIGVLSLRAVRSQHQR